MFTQKKEKITANVTNHKANDPSKRHTCIHQTTFSLIISISVYHMAGMMMIMLTRIVSYTIVTRTKATTMTTTTTTMTMMMMGMTMTDDF